MGWEGDEKQAILLQWPNIPSLAPIVLSTMYTELLERLATADRNFLLKIVTNHANQPMFR